ncbi:MAG: hypothetical protein AAGI24_06050 [Pseudomonadota bacterium]
MKTFLVGGAVRDRLLGLAVSERDYVVVGATPQEMEAQGYRQVGRDFPVFLHPDTSDEYALARTERKHGQGHRGFEVHSDPKVTLEEDLRRRDLTINAMAETVDGDIIDPYHGQQDLHARSLRHVSEAFIEDPLRVLRVARFAARFSHLGFSVAEGTRALMQTIADSGELLTLSAERIWSETGRALATDSPWVYVDVLASCGALHVLLPELRSVRQAGERLKLAAKFSHSVDIRFAALLDGLDSAAVDSTCARLNAPKQARALAMLWVTQAGALSSAATLSAEAVLTVIESADALRRPERFDALLEILQALVPDADPEFWRCVGECVASVDAAAIAAEGHAGHEIAARLRLQRISAIERLR